MTNVRQEAERNTSVKDVRDLHRESVRVEVSAVVSILRHDLRPHATQGEKASVARSFFLLRTVKSKHTSLIILNIYYK